MPFSKFVHLVVKGCFSVWGCLPSFTSSFSLSTCAFKTYRFMSLFIICCWERRNDSITNGTLLSKELYMPAKQTAQGEGFNVTICRRTPRFQNVTLSHLLLRLTAYLTSMSLHPTPRDRRSFSQRFSWKSSIRGFSFQHDLSLRRVDTTLSSIDTTLFLIAVVPVFKQNQIYAQQRELRKYREEQQRNTRSHQLSHHPKRICWYFGVCPPNTFL